MHAVQEPLHAPTFRPLVGGGINTEQRAHD